MEARRRSLLLMREYARRLLSTGLSHGAKLILSPRVIGGVSSSSRAAGGGSGECELHAVLHLLGGEADAFVHPLASGAAMQSAHMAVRDIDNARATRVSQINADLPNAQWLTLNLLGGLLLSSFLLLELHAPKLEALLFGALCATSTMFVYVIQDLADPFHGCWSVGPAEEAVADLHTQIDAAWQVSVGHSFALNVRNLSPGSALSQRQADTRKAAQSPVSSATPQASA